MGLHRNLKPNGLSWHRVMSVSVSPTFSHYHDDVSNKKSGVNINKRKLTSVFNSINPTLTLKLENGLNILVLLSECTNSI